MNQRTKVLNGSVTEGWTEHAIPEHAETTARRVVGAALRVHRKLGAGFKESVYQRCLVHALRRDGCMVRENARLSVEFEGLVIDNAGHPDLIVGDCVIVELKAVADLPRVSGAQVVNYLKASGLQVGLLINFNVPLLVEGIHRYVHPDLLHAPVKRP